MRKLYLVRKNPEIRGGEDNWIIMNAYEFARFAETEEGQLRKDSFERLPSADRDDDILYIECDRKEAKGIKQERNRADYRERLEEEQGIEFLSLDAPLDEGDDGESITLLDLLADEGKDTECMALNALRREELPAALSGLDPEERELMLAIYLGDGGVTVNSYAQKHGVTRWSVRQNHKNAIRKLRFYYRRKKLF